MGNIKTDWIRACVSGATVDGREITDQQITDMAELYAVDTYVAHLWMEHIRGVMPDMFKSLGDVVQVKAEPIKGGALDGRMGLYVILEPHQDLITMVRNGQKVHLSIEMNTSFMDTGRAYLMGLGVTDSPASLGTGLMKFSTQARNQHIFSEPLICELGNCQPDQGSELVAIRALLEQLTAQAVDKTPIATRADFERLSQDVEALRQQIEFFGNQEVVNHGKRPEITGMSGEHFELNRRQVGY